MSKLCYLLLTIFILIVGCTVEVPQASTNSGDTNTTSMDTAKAQIETPRIENETMENSSNADADVIFVKATQSGNGAWRFDVTVEHPDTGWQDYADGWDVVLPDGTVVKTSVDDSFTRLLLHPHENEQPFTRSQSNLQIPENITQITVRAHDLVDGWGGQVIMVDLTQDSGEGFEVSR